jgi:diguanylate cyclase (GGDEF)-like protein
MTKLADHTSRLQAEKQQLENRSRTDLLTGVNNRHGLSLFLHEFYSGERLPAGTGVVVLDIDHFKRLNDTYGHDAGDQVLINFAALIKGAIRARDIFARWGGEEFVLILDNLNLEKLTFTCEKLRQLVAENKLLANFDTQVTVSIGAVLTNQIELFDTAFKRADTALYRAKSSRNKVEYGV